MVFTTCKENAVISQVSKKADTIYAFGSTGAPPPTPPPPPPPPHHLNVTSVSVLSTQFTFMHV